MRDAACPISTRGGGGEGGGSTSDTIGASYEKRSPSALKSSSPAPESAEEVSGGGSDRPPPSLVLSGHAASLTRTNRTRRGPPSQTSVNNELLRRVNQRLSVIAGDAGVAAAERTQRTARGGAPPPRTKWTRRVPHPVLIGHAASLTPY